MKLIKAKVYFTKLPDKTVYSGGYPSTWDSTRIPYICYGEKNNDGRDFQWLIVIVPDDLYDVMIEDEQCEAVTKDDARTFVNEYRPQTEKITSEFKLMKILAKNARGEELEQVELDALNPDHPEPGLGKTKSFAEICDKYEI